MNEIKTSKKETAHNIILEDKSKLSVSGVIDVDSFDEKTIIIFTENDTLTVKGSDLHIKKLNLDVSELVIEGEIYSMIYSESSSKKSSGGFLSKLLS